MTKADLIVTLHQIRQDRDPERAHVTADDCLLRYINDTEIADAYRAIRRWYS